MSLTAPLGLLRHVRRPDLRLEVVPWLNLLLIGWLLSLLGSQFIYAPGLSIALANGPVGALPGDLPLPVLPGDALPGRRADAALTVLTAKQDQVFIFERGIYNIATLRETFKNRPRPPLGTESVLLIKAGREVTMQTFLELCLVAQQAGFTAVQVAAESAPEQPPRVSPISLPP